MTTIAYKDGVIAYDSQATKSEFYAQSSNREKMILREDGVRFFLTGGTHVFEEFINAWPDGNLGKDTECGGLVIDLNGKLWETGCLNEYVWKASVYLDESYALGSGGEFAKAAMECGKDAVGAVEIAVSLDIYTGGKVRTFIVGRASYEHNNHN